MRLPKRYGMSQERLCPFCSKQALSTNGQGVPVCKNHSATTLPEVKCVCGSWLELREGKWGPFFLCLQCGPVAFKKGIEMLKFMKPKEAIQTKTAEVNKPATAGTSSASGISASASHASASPSSHRHSAPFAKAKQRMPANQVVRSDDPRFFD